MDRSEVTKVYDDGYADIYDMRFILSPWAATGAEFEEDQLRGLLEVDDDPHWLDLGCGTGNFLSRFPGVARAGLDLSPAMVAKATEANPDAEFIREGSFLDDVDEWHDAWSLLSCMWTPYNYLASVWEVEELVANMIRWTRPGGACFIPVMDLEDIRHVVTPYEEVPGEFGGVIALTSITWTWDEPHTGKHHEHLIAPQIGHFVRLFELEFETVEVVRYPLFQNVGPSRKAVVAKGKRPRADGVTAEVIWHDPPEPLPDPEPGGRGETADTAVGGGVPYTALPTGVLSRELLRRVNPFDERFRRGLRRRIDGRRNR